MNSRHAPLSGLRLRVEDHQRVVVDIEGQQFVSGHSRAVSVAGRLQQVLRLEVLEELLDSHGVCVDHCCHLCGRDRLPSLVVPADEP